MKTPYFLIKEKLLQQNVQEFIDGMKASWENCQLAYSVKTNSLPWVLEYMREKHVFAEVVSDEEYQLARLCGYVDDQIVFNGPIKSDQLLEEALQNGAFVNVDSHHELNCIRKKKLYTSKIGVRINVPSQLFCSHDIDYIEDGFRFGFSEENGELEQVINLLDKFCERQKIGFHLHCNSVTRSPDVYRNIAKYIVKLIDQYDIYPSYIDIGGGFFGGVPGKTTPYEYFKIIADELTQTDRTKDTLLIAEPGSAIIGSAVELHTSVIDVKDTAYSRIVTTDGSRIHIDPLWKKTSYLYQTNASGRNLHKQIICGYTCMDHDRIMIIMDQPELKVEDRIIYERVGAYTMTFGGPFIRYFPEVYVETEGKIVKVRDRMNVTDYYKIHSS